MHGSKRVLVALSHDGGINLLHFHIFMLFVLCLEEQHGFPLHASHVCLFFFLLRVMCMKRAVTVGSTYVLACLSFQALI